MTSHEIEIKIRCDDLAAFEKAGIRLELIEPRHFEENVLFDTPDQQLAQRFAILRVRAALGSGALTYKAPPAPGEAQSQFKKRVEIETPIAHPEHLIEIVTRLGYVEWFRYQKYRTSYRAHLPDGDSIMVMNDETPLGTFVELEGEEHAIQKTVERLGVSPDQYIQLSYIALQVRHCQAEGKPFEDMVFD
jgi:adenylate cyclase, class 2